MRLTPPPQRGAFCPGNGITPPLCGPYLWGMRTAIAPLLLLLAAWPYRPVKAQLQVVVEPRTFYTPAGDPLVEVNMAFLAGTFGAQGNGSTTTQGRIEVTTLVERDGAIIDFGKTVVSGSEAMDSLPHDMLHQEFFALAPGYYDLAIDAVDLTTSDTAVMRYRAPLVVATLPPGISITDILLCERIVPAVEGERSKYGYTAVPLLMDYLPAAIKQLNFYAEVHGTGKTLGVDSLYLLTYQIEGFESKTVFGPYKRSIRAKARPVEPVIAEFDIGELPSGNYVLAVEARDRTGQLIARKEQFFQRNNPVRYNYDLQAMDRLDLEGKFANAFANRDTLVEHIASLRPIADPLEAKIIDDRYKDRDVDLMKRFFYSFWANRSADPEQAWNAYRQEVIKVNKLFGCRVLKGYETDRGRVYLKYGPPNTMMDRFNEMGTLPYTIWHYYRAGHFTNRRFVFYQPEMANYCMQLLHSEVPGEMNNPQWNNILHQRNVAMPGVQTVQPGTLESDRVMEYFNDPR